MDELFTAIDHVGVAVPDLDAAIAFYRDSLGMRLLHEESNPEQGVREAMMGVGSSGACVQLLAPLTPESTIAAFLERSGPGLQQVAYRVDDVDAVSEVLRGRGLRLLYPEARRGTAASRINFIHPKDAGGVLVELVEPARLYHLCLADEHDPQAREITVSTRGRTLADEGFIHLCTRDQLAGVVERFYDDVRGELLVLTIDPEALPRDALRHEQVDGGSYPHLYAPLPAEAVLSVRAWRD